ncbi:hypothetical protein T440DRAFT_105522 [Plenodomus tracheiphilus IPT5]|uniref:Uncharacterized protein n=1 Tax=Plenodomus tracheiphilus IPT5 TaxID=1408161 RepID=A0A6A7BLM9_9PLEO|nr:hypothetical protein T440DRAFT_105522 [Plenodomus tracheiphilus IPT5]
MMLVSQKTPSPPTLYQTCTISILLIVTWVKSGMSCDHVDHVAIMNPVSQRQWVADPKSLELDTNPSRLLPPPAGPARLPLTCQILRIPTPASPLSAFRPRYLSKSSSTSHF